MSTKNTPPAPPPIFLAAAAATQVVMTRRCTPTARSRVFASLIAAASAALAGSAVVTLRRHETTIEPVHPDRTRRLVTAGPFARTRNPIYLALAGLLVAHAVYRRSMAALVPAAAFVAVIDRVQVPYEEQALNERFGARYRRYRRAVPRWVGAAEW
ncbi:methyltransferase family protein [Microbacterium terrisoli]|jgi:protein-S-isoprenylcysteine O-methyltransferase Ste14|uniref:methyltransferase family protein n=1 Tax=Microbacterium terrisoli TaxID=3242192 RepID=UPI0028059DC6|nr:methyltransferase [Microbacterium protaetiae]